MMLVVVAKNMLHIVGHSVGTVFSKIGTYVGTGSANNGAFIYCGFKPVSYLDYVKSISTTNRWVMYDNKHSDGGGN